MENYFEMYVLLLKRLSSTITPEETVLLDELGAKSEASRQFINDCNPARLMNEVRAYNSVTDGDVAVAWALLKGQGWKDLND